MTKSCLIVARCGMCGKVGKVRSRIGKMRNEFRVVRDGVMFLRDGVRRGEGSRA